MSAQEFAQWSVMFSAEELHPSWARLRHAQLMAALHNGPLTRRGNKLWAAIEFLRDVWKRPDPKKPAPTPEQIAAQVASINSMRRSRGGK